jgi:hypothetical protein
MERLKLQNSRKPFYAARFFSDDVARNARRECERKPHVAHDIEPRAVSQVPQA